jgi:hypothetical protein
MVEHPMPECGVTGNEVHQTAWNKEATPWMTKFNSSGPDNGDDCGNSTTPQNPQLIRGAQ